MGRLLRTGERVGAYEILRLLASGGEGASYLARHAARGEVVLKQYALSASEPSCRAEAERIERRKALIGVRHPCVAEVLDIFVDGDLYYEVLEYVAGVSLEERLERGLLLTEDEAVSVARCCLEGLVWLHTEVRLVHRDIKPGNVMLLEGPSGELQCKLIDMGIVLFLDHTRLTVSGVACTFLYAAPEAFLGPKAAIDGRADLHSLAVTLFESVAGTLPFRGTTVESLITEICGPHRPRLRDAAAGISPRFDAFVAKLMAPKPEDRPASARKALNLLDALPLRESRDEERPDGEDDDDDEVEHEDEDEDEKKEGRGPALHIVSGSLRGRRIRIPESGLALGRAMFGPDDRKASRFHARATLHGATLLLTDLDSMNGLIYRGKRRQKVRLATGESVTLGATTLVYHEKGI